MIRDKSIDRLEYLAQKFDVFENDERLIEEKIKSISDDETVISFIENNDTKLALCVNKNGAINVSVSLETFSNIIAADPTINKSCVQWMLTIFVRYIKLGKYDAAKQLVLEDLPLANDYIKIFEANKYKARFKDYCNKSYILKNVSDPLNINQYKSLSQLFDAVDPFIKRDSTKMESLLNKFVMLGEAEIPVKDRRFTLYIPKSRDASVIFNGFANWCTVTPNNGMYQKYTSNLTATGKKSNLFIIIDNKFFTEESKDIYQIHFESHQLRDRSNNEVCGFFDKVLKDSEGLLNYFHEYLLTEAKAKKSIDSNMYVDYLIKFGFCESLFELIEPSTPIIKFMTREIPRLPDLSRFVDVDQIVITKANLSVLHPSIGKLSKLELLSLPKNNITELPREIGNLKNLGFLNLSDNPISMIPDEIKYLDKSNGGSLFRLSISKEKIGEKNYKRLKELLPTTSITG